MNTYSFPEKYLGGSDEKLVTFPHFVLTIFGVAVNHLQTGFGKASMTLAGRESS